MSKANTGQIYFHYMADPFHFEQRNRLKTFIKGLLRRERKRLDTINYIFCTDAYLLRLNKTHLKHNTLTDIITFEYNEVGEPLLSDIYISIERVKENATLFNSSFKRELQRVIFHGALHLCGFKDKTPEQSQLMRRKEEEYLHKWLVSRGTT
jgi:rRNA maturation RNase YbeY